MIPVGFPTQTYLETLVDFVDRMDYNDTNYPSREHRASIMRYVYSHAAAHFAQPRQQRYIKTKPTHLQAGLQCIVAMVVGCWPAVPIEAKADIAILYTYMLILDDSIDAQTGLSMQTFYVDMLQGQPQKHWWLHLVNEHMPGVLRHYGPFSSFNIVRSIFDFFQGCWIEQSGFNGYNGAYDYPMFLRRLNGLGHCVLGTLFPKQVITDHQHIADLASVLAELDTWSVLINDLLSFWKEFDQPRDQTSLVNSYMVTHNLSVDDALQRIYVELMASTEQLMTVLAQIEEPTIRHTLYAFCQGQLTWHLSNRRYRLSDLRDDAACATSEAGRRFSEYQRAADRVGKIPSNEWVPATVQQLAVNRSKHDSAFVALPPTPKSECNGEDGGEALPKRKDSPIEGMEGL